MKTVELKELNKIEMIEITGGSEHSEGIVYFLGCVVRGCVEFAQGASAGSQEHGGVFYK